MVLLQSSLTPHSDSDHTGSAKRDSANGVAGINISKEVINTVPFNILKTAYNQSFENLINNGDFQVWSSGSTSAPDSWTYTQSGAGGGIVQIADTKVYTHIARITKSDTLNSYIQNNVSICERYRNKKITVGCWIKSANTVANKISIVVYDGIASSTKFYENTGNWEFITITRNMHANTNTLWIRCIIHTDANATADFAGAIMVEGEMCLAPGPKSAPTTNPVFIGYIKKSNNNGITGHAGGGQGSAVELKKDINEVSICATNGDSVKLPAAIVGMQIIVINHGAATMDLFPATGNYINEGVINTAVNIAINGTAVAFCYDTNKWEIIEAVRA